MSRTAHPPGDRQINMVELQPRRENLSVSGNVCISATLSTTNLTHGLESNSGLHPTQPDPGYGLRTATKKCSTLTFKILMPEWVRHKRDM